MAARNRGAVDLVGLFLRVLFDLSWGFLHCVQGASILRILLRRVYIEVPLIGSEVPGVVQIFGFAPGFLVQPGLLMDFGMPSVVQVSLEDPFGLVPPDS